MAHRIRRNLLILVSTVSVVCVATAQQAAIVELPHFDVASVKPEDPNVRRIMGVRVHPGGRVEIAGFPLKTLITTAFDLGFEQISGGDEWVSKDTYFVEANSPTHCDPRSRASGTQCSGSMTRFSGKCYRHY